MIEFYKYLYAGGGAYKYQKYIRNVKAEQICPAVHLISHLYLKWKVKSHNI